jgi:hypothetical protein
MVKEEAGYTNSFNGNNAGHGGGKLVAHVAESSSEEEEEDEGSDADM